VDEAEQDVLGADVVVVEHPRLFLRQHDHPRARSVNRSNMGLVGRGAVEVVGEFNADALRHGFPSSVAMVVRCPTIYCRRIYTQTSHAAIPELSLGTYPMRLPVSTGAKKDFT
jgi:hypothetical protein